MKKRAHYGFISVGLIPQTQSYIPLLKSQLEDWAIFGSAATFTDTLHVGIPNNGRMIGSFGSLEVLSFHETKFFNTLEGGAITTNDDRLAEKIRLIRNFGFLDYDQVVAMGTNGKLNEISAAMGLNLLDCLEDLFQVNYRNYRQYENELEGRSGIQLLRYNEAEKCNFQHIVLEVDEAKTGINRDQLVDLLWAENVLARGYYYPGCHRMEPYASENLSASARHPSPVTKSFLDRVISLPTGTAIGKQ